MAAPWPIAVVALQPISTGTVLWRMGGILRVTVVVKATFGLVHEGAARLLPPADVLAEDHVREPMSGAIDEASDVAPYLPSAGVVMSGHAYAPGGRATSGMAVRLAIFRDDRPLLDKTLHVFGYRPPVPNAAPQPFQKIPLSWDRAYGGPTIEDNPAGSGAPGSRAQPNVLDPADPARPAGFGPIARSWGARRRLLGLADPAAIARPSPDIPEGFDFRWFHAAPLDQQIDLLRGDEWIVLEGVHPALAGITTRLPSARAEARAYVPGEAGTRAGMPVDLVADTLIIDADRQTLSVVWRGSFGVDPNLADSIPALRVHAGLEMPGYPVVWPGPQHEPPSVAADAQPPQARTLPMVGDAVSRTAAMSAEPPSPPNRAVAMAAEAPARPAARPADASAPPGDAPLPRFFDDDDDLKAKTRAISVKGVPLPALPFRPAEPRPAEPPAPAPRPLDAALPFRPVSATEPPQPPPAIDAAPAFGPPPTATAPPPPPPPRVAVPAPQFGAPPAPEPQDAAPTLTIKAKPFDDDDERTSLVDLRRVRAVTPFAITEPGARPVANAMPLPGAPWSGPAEAVVPPLSDDVTTLDADSVSEILPDEILDEATPPTEEHRIEPTRMPAFLASASPAQPSPAQPASSSAVFPFAPPLVAPPAPAKPADVLPAPPPLLSPSPVAPPPLVPRPDAPLVAPPPLVASKPADVLPAPPPLVASKPADVLPAPPPLVASKPADVHPAPPPLVAPPPAVDLPPPPRLSIADPPSGTTTLDAPTFVDPPRPAPPVEPPPPPPPAPPAEATLRDKVVAALAAGEGLRAFDLEGADLHGIDLRRALLGNAKLRGANLQGALLEGARLGDADLSGADLTGADLTSADLSRADLTRANLTSARLAGATLTDANLSSARGPGATFTAAVARRASFARGAWEGAVFDRLDAVTIDFSEANITRASFREATLIELKLEGAEGDAAIFDDARMPDARAEGATLTACSFARADAKGSIWDQATLDRSRFEGATLDDTSFLAAAAASSSFARATAKNANFERISADAADFTGASLEDGNLRQARLHDAVFDGANLRGVSANRADLSRARLLRADLDCAVFRAGKLTAAVLAHGNLEGADLRDADLERANLFSARRKTTKLNGANTKDIVETDPEG